MLSTSTSLDRASRALDYARLFIAGLEYFWVAIGKTSPWQYEESPPRPSPLLSYIPEIVGFFPVERCELVYPVKDGPIVTTAGQFNAIANWPESSPAELAASYATNVYLETTIAADDRNVGTSYRMVGLCRNIVPVNNHLLSKSSLTAGQVRSYSLDWISSFPPTFLTLSGKSTVQIVRQF